MESPEGSLDDTLEAEFQAARQKVSDSPASLSSLFADDEVLEVDATVQDESLLVSCACDTHHPDNLTCSMLSTESMELPQG